ncbi:MAG TPA: DUF2156 domain-containing protein [Candidatus Aphodomorpha intestinavium]|uniref:DUF2156 domain-containing protein n=1 Tax=Candidatus Aphodomorpha intestinavium TaxID=2840672 RepID=A0A9D1N3V6_9FIRM|nr:DUF2156 domain-containing protein [Candidatus Aphodomorpha intestinavium]
MITFQPVTDEAALRLVDYLAGQPYRSCDYTIGAIYQWRAYFASAVAFVGPVAVLRADYPFPEDGHSYMFPIGGGGSAAIEAALDAVEEYTAALGIPLRYCAVPEAGAAVLRARYGARAVCTAHRDWADYLYMLDDLKTFPGKRFHGQRNHLNRFYKDNPGSRYVPITWMTLPRARAFLTEYVYRTPARSPIEAEEQCRAQELLEAVSLLQLQAGYLETARGDIVALAIGEVVGDTLYVHVEKARLDYPGAYQAIVSAFACHAAQPDTRYCNREDDSGEEGLRRSKEAYHPVAMIDKYWVNIAPARP